MSGPTLAHLEARQAAIRLDLSDPPDAVGARTEAPLRDRVTGYLGDQPQLRVSWLDRVLRLELRDVAPPISKISPSNGEVYEELRPLLLSIATAKAAGGFGVPVPEGLSHGRFSPCLETIALANETGGQTMAMQVADQHDPTDEDALEGSAEAVGPLRSEGADLMAGQVVGVVFNELVARAGRSVRVRRHPRRRAR